MINKLRKEKLLQITNALIEEASDVVESRFKPNALGAPICVNVQLLHKWWGKVKSLGHQLGTAARPWQEMFAKNPDSNTLFFVNGVLGTLEAIKHEIENDHLVPFTQLVRAETFSDLLEQSEHLFQNGYYLAAGVIGRAVLEEHLRTTCAALGCTPTKQRSTINDFNQALYGGQHYSKIAMKQIDALAAIGNDAAHNKPGLDSNDVKKLLSDIPGVIESTSI